MNLKYYTFYIQEELKQENIFVSKNNIRKIINSFLSETINNLRKHRIIDWIRFQFQYDIPRLRKDIERNPDEYKDYYKPNKDN